MGDQRIIAKRAAKVIRSHIFVQVLLNKSSGQKSLHAASHFYPDEVICQFSAGITQSYATYLTIQIAADKHITLVPDFLQYINHSCAPTVFFDTTRMELVCLKEIHPGDELTYFYPSTEWEMAQPFICNCGNPECLQIINGAAHLSSVVLDKYRLTDFIRQMMSAEMGRPEKEIKDMLKAHFETLKTSLMTGVEINIQGFGKISFENQTGKFVYKKNNQKKSNPLKTGMVFEPDAPVTYAPPNGNEHVEGHYLQDYNIDSLDDIYTTNTKKILKNLITDLGIEQKVLAEKVFHITSNTLRSYRLEKNKELPPRLKELAISIKELYVKGQEIFLTNENFNKWLNHEQIGLEGRKPIELINTITGIHLVIEELSRIEFGATA